MVFLPPNTTSVLQPCDQGIIKTVKYDYRRRMLRRLIKLLDMDDGDITASKMIKQIILFDACVMLSESWTALSADAIRNCWRKGGFGSKVSSTTGSIDHSDHLVKDVCEALMSLGMSSSITKDHAKNLLENGFPGEDELDSEDENDLMSSIVDFVAHDMDDDKG